MQTRMYQMFTLFYFFIFYRTPLFLAVRKQDLRAMKLLLDFNADPDAIIIDEDNADPRMRRRSLLSIAVYNGSAECAKMLLVHGANPLPQGTEPLIATLNNETRETLAVLLQDRPRDVLRVIEEKPFIVHAIEMKSNLLPIIVTLVKKQIKEMEDNHEDNIPKYPPKGLKRSQKKELEKAESLQDERITADFVTDAVKAIKNPWKNINDQTLYLSNV